MFCYLYFIMVTKLFGFEISSLLECSILTILAFEICFYFAATMYHISEYLEKK